MRKTRLFVSALSLGLLVAAAVATPSFAQQGRTVTVTIGPGRDEATATGTATLTDMGNGTTRVEVNVAGTNPTMPGHIHADVCPAAGPVVFPLEPTQNGRGTTVLNASLSDVLARGKAINFHKSPQQAAIYTGCGNLAAAAAQAAPSQVPAALPRTGDPGSLAPLAAAVGAGLAGAGLALRRRFGR